MCPCDTPPLPASLYLCLFLALRSLSLSLLPLASPCLVCSLAAPCLWVSFCFCLCFSSCHFSLEIFSSSMYFALRVHLIRTLHFLRKTLDPYLDFMRFTIKQVDSCAQVFPNVLRGSPIMKLSMTCVIKIKN